MQVPDVVTESAAVPGADLRVAGRRALARLASAGPLYMTMIGLSLVFSFPFLWSIFSSLKTGAEWFIYPPPLLPEVPQWKNYLEVFHITAADFPVGSWIYNSVYIVVLATLGTVAAASLVAFGFARFRFPGRDLLFMLTLSTMMLPSQVTLIPQFILFHRIGWLDTHLPLWVPSWFGGGAFYIFLMRQFLMTLPQELDEAARIDGAGYFLIFSRILIPLCRPVLATMAIISVMSHWNNFIGPLVYINSTAKFTISVGLRFFSEDPDSAWGEPLQHLLMAAAVLSILPIIVVFFAGQRFFVRGIAMTGLKG